MARYFSGCRINIRLTVFTATGRIFTAFVSNQLLFLQINVIRKCVSCITAGNSDLPEAFVAYFWAHADHVNSPQMALLLDVRFVVFSAILIMMNLFSFERK